MGRLTRALHDYFPECCGVDISRGMLQKARQIAPQCEFREANDLRSFPAQYADLIYSSLVLQHQPDKAHVIALIKDMVRVLAPGGLLVFQMPLHLPLRNRIQLRRRAYRLVRALGLPHTFAYERLKLSPIRMLCTASARRGRYCSPGEWRGCFRRPCGKAQRAVFQRDLLLHGKALSTVSDLQKVFCVPQEQKQHSPEPAQDFF